MNNRDEKRKNIIIAVLCFTLVLMSVGYATYTSALTMNGTAEIQETSWGVELTNASKMQLVGQALATTEPTVTGGNRVNYAVQLNAIGDSATFTVDIMNTGTLPAELDALNIDGANEHSYIKYNVTGINVGDVLNKGEKKTVSVSVQFIQPTNVSELPTQGATLNLTANFDFVQAN